MDRYSSFGLQNPKWETFSLHHQLRTILQRLGEMRGLDLLTPCTIRNSTRQFQDTMLTLLDSRSRPLRPGSWMEPGENYWIRVTTLTDEVSHALETKVLRSIPSRLSLHKMDFRVDDVLTRRSEHEWAGETSFSNMAQDVAMTSSGSRVRIEFASPTAFRSNGLDIVCRLPFKYFVACGKDGTHLLLSRRRSMNCGHDL